MAKSIPNFYDFPKSSGGITSENEFYLLADGNISIRAGIEDAAKVIAYPRVDLNISDGASPDDVTLAAIFHRIYHDSASGITNISVGSGMFYAVSNIAGGSSGISAAFNDENVVPWESQYQTSLHYGHDPADPALNTYIKVLTYGLYKIEYTIGTNTTNLNTVRTGCEVVCKRNNSTVIPGSKTYTYNRNYTVGRATASWIGYAWLNPGDIVSIHLTEDGTTNDNVIKKQTCSICLTFINPGV